MIKKSFIVIVVGLLANLFLGQYSPLYSQSELKLNNSKKYNLSLNKISLSNTLFDSTYKQEPLVLKPLTTDDIISQFVVGFGLGGAATFVTAAAGAGLSGFRIDLGGGSNSTSAFGIILFLSLIATVQVFATAGGVWSAGTSKKVGSDFGYTLLGAFVGLGLEIGGLLVASAIGNSSSGRNGSSTIAWITSLSSLTFPTIGAMIGLNSSRYPKRVYGKPKTIINLNSDGVTFSSPSIYIELDKTLHRKPITFAKMFSISF
jgi:hypothetical protein